MEIFPKDPGKVLVKIAYLVVIFAILYFLLPIIIKYAMPFIVAYVISKMISPAADFLEKKFRFPKRLSIAVVMLLFIGLLVWLLFMLFYQAAYELQRFASVVPSLLDGDFSLPSWVERINKFYTTLPESMQEFVVMITDNLRGNISTILEPATQSVINAATKFASALPNAIIFTVIMILSTYFICSDKEKIREFFKQIIPTRILRRATYVKNDLIKACGGYLKAQLILMCVTFTVLLVGLAVLGVKSAVLVAFVIAVVDVIPILGTGTVLLPWTAISLISGRYFFAFGLLIIYAISFLIRRLSEPKIVSQQIGLHPLATLISIYVGLKSVGVLGMILGPIVTIIIINFFKSEKRYEEEMADKI